MTSPKIPQSPETPQGAAVSSTTAGETPLWEAATQGLALANLAAQVFETGVEPPSTEPDVALLRDALRSARLDLDLLGAAIEHASPETVTRAALRAETQITFALALHAFLRRYRDPIGSLVTDTPRSEQANPGNPD